MYFVLTVSKTGSLHDDLCATRKGLHCNCPSAALAELPETRVVVGCADMAQGTLSALELRGYKVTSVRSDSVPVRTREERNRASRLLAAVFGN